jgi:hypothetical protein
MKNKFNLPGFTAENSNPNIFIFTPNESIPSLSSLRKNPFQHNNEASQIFPASRTTIIGTRPAGSCTYVCELDPWAFTFYCYYACGWFPRS